MRKLFFFLSLIYLCGIQETAARPQALSGASPVPILQFEGPDQGNTSIYTAGIAGAVGIDHIMSIRNSAGINDPSIYVYGKNGQLLATRSFNTYFPVNISAFSDPRVAFDHIQQRWIVTATAIYNGNKHLCVMYSKTSDPTGAWQTFTPILSIFSSMAQPKIGFSDNWIVISCYYEDGSNNGSSIVYTWKRQGFYSGVNGVYWSSQGFNMGHLCPASTYDAGVGDLYLVSVNSPTSGGKIRVSRVYGSPANDPQFDLTGALINVNNAWSNTALYAPQFGAPGILLPNHRINSAVYRNGSIWFAHNIFLPSSGANRAVVQWGQVLAGANTLAQLGRIDGGASNQVYGLPSIAVDLNNNVLVGFNRFSSTGYPSAAYTYHYAADPPGYMNDLHVLQNGLSTFSQAWGDYSSTVVDPVDNSMWTLQQYAKSNNKWGTQWAKVGGIATCGDLCGTDDQEWIGNFSLNGNTGFLAPPGGNYGGCIIQGLFDAFFAVLKKGVYHKFTLTPGFSGAAHPEFWKIWIDFNRDDKFDGPGELVYASTVGSFGTVQDSFFMPLWVPEGPALMRVAMRRGSPPPDCDNFLYGQVITYNSIYIDECNISFFDACAREYIQMVELNTISNVSNCGVSGYQDFTSLSTDLDAGASYLLKLTPGYIGPAQHPERWLAWIDYNHDYDFNDAGELVFDSGVNGFTMPVTGMINIPASAVSTSTKMRVKMIPTDAAFASLDPCEPIPGLFVGPDQFGEAEDYTVVINGNKLQVQGGFSPESLVKDVLIGGDCYDISNVSYLGGDFQIGQFNNGLSNIGFNNGIILATGLINLAPGPNDSNGVGSSGVVDSDIDLASIATGQLFDVSAIEFDITPTQPFLSFDYVFASEEYCEYVNTAFSDVFGIFISGPGIVGAKNLAVVPSTNTPVSINSINHVVNSSLYVHNTPLGLDNCETGGVTGSLPPAIPANGPAVHEVQYDGFTTKLTAVTPVIPCATYHVKIAIADVGDGVWDSAVFLKAGSFSGNGNATLNWLVDAQPGLNEATEGCNTVQIQATRLGSNSSLPLPVSFTVSGTASAGSDYSPFASTVVIPAGQNQVLLPVNILNDLIVEAPETIILTLNNACSCLNPNKVLTIKDYQQMVLTPDTVNICGPGSTATIGVGHTGGAAPYSYQWSNGMSSQNITVSVNATTNYTVTVTDGCGKTKTAVARVVIAPVPSAQLLSSQQQICPNGVATIMVSFTGTGPFNLSYSKNGTVQPTVTNIAQNPYPLIINMPGLYQGVSVVDKNGCAGTGSGSVVVTFSTLSVTGTEINPSCPASNNGSINTTVTGGLSPYTYAWQGPTSVGNIADPNGLAPGNYFLTVTDGYGCSVIKNFAIVAPPAIQIAINVSGSTIVVQASGGTGFFQYSIDGINFQAGNQFNNLTCGNYTVTARDMNGCSATKQAMVNVLSGSFQNTNILCFGGSATITLTPSCGVPPYLYAIGNAPFQTGNTFTGMVAGTYSATIKDANGATVAIGPITLNQPSALQVMANVVCNDATLTFSGGTPPYAFTSSPPAGNLMNLPNGSYQITAMDVNGCVAASTFNVNILPLDFSFTTVGVTCFGGNNGSIALSGIGGCPPYTYSINGSPFVPNNVFSDLAFGTYILTIRDSKNIEKFKPVTVSQPALPLMLSATVNGNAIIANASGGIPPYTYSLNGGAQQSNPGFNNLPVGTYTLMTTDAQGCTALKGNLTVTSGIVEPAIAWGMTIMPNPSTGLYTLAMQNPPDVLHAAVFDLTGRLLQTLIFEPVGRHLSATLDLQNLPQGTYLLRLSDGKNWGAVLLSKVD